jgi:hypothetical protein
MFDRRAWQDHQAISPASRRIRQKVRGRTKAEVRGKLQALHRELEAGPRVSATCTVASCIWDWPGDGPTTRQASTVENDRRLADHVIGRLGAVKVKDVTARQVQKALAELAASLSDPLAAAASTQRQADKLARPRGTAALAAGR